MYGSLKTSAYWDPWHEIDAFGSNLGKLLEIFPEVLRTGDYPPVNAYRNGDSLLFTVEIPGIELDNLEITVKNDTLSLKGNRSLPEIPQDANYRRQERGAGTFVRDIALPFRVEPDSVEAIYKNGILSIKAEKAIAERPRKISIKTIENA